MRKPLDKGLPQFLDFEASSLAVNSYPIEVARSDDSGKIKSFLISPEIVEAWTDWDLAAQNIHGIRREELLSKGAHPKVVCQELKRSLENRAVYSDVL